MGPCPGNRPHAGAVRLVAAALIRLSTSTLWSSCRAGLGRDPASLVGAESVADSRSALKEQLDHLPVQFVERRAVAGPHRLC